MTVRLLHGRSRCELAVVGEKVDRSCTASKSATSGVWATRSRYTEQLLLPRVRRSL